MSIKHSKNRINLRITVPIEINESKTCIVKGCFTSSNKKDDILALNSATKNNNKRGYCQKLIRSGKWLELISLAEQKCINGQSRQVIDFVFKTLRILEHACTYL